MLEMEIREYRDSDAEEVAEVLRKSIREIAADDYSEEEVAVWSDTDTENWELEKEEKRYVAVEEDNIVGFSGYKKDEKKLRATYVRPEWAGKGLGSRLLKKVEEEARKDGIDRLTCKATITARNFYEKNGWEVIEKTVQEVEDQELDVYKMEKEL